MKELIFTLTLANTADLASTEYALNNGAVEANLLMRNSVARYTLKSVGTAIEIWAVRKLEKKGSKKAAHILKWTIVGLNAGIATSNIYQANK